MLRAVDGGVGEGDHGHMSGPVGRFDERRVEMLLRPGAGQRKHLEERAARKEAAAAAAKWKWFFGRGTGGGEGGGGGGEGEAGKQGRGPQGPYSSRGWRGPVRRAQDVAEALKDVPAQEGAKARVVGAGANVGGGGGAGREQPLAPNDETGEKGVRFAEKRAGESREAKGGADVDVDPEDGFDFASLYERLWSDRGARRAVRTAATAGLLAMRAAATQRRQAEEVERAREREERKRQKTKDSGGDA